MKEIPTIRVFSKKNEKSLKSESNNYLKDIGEMERYLNKKFDINPIEISGLL